MAIIIIEKFIDKSANTQNLITFAVRCRVLQQL